MNGWEARRIWVTGRTSRTRSEGGESLISRVSDFYWGDEEVRGFWTVKLHVVQSCPETGDSVLGVRYPPIK